MSQAAIELQSMAGPIKLVSEPAPTTVVSTRVNTLNKVDFSLNIPTSHRRVELEQFISDRFSATYGAAIVEFCPLLLSRTDNGHLSSVAGLRPGTVVPLFLEQYLDLSLEDAISGISGSDVSRNEVMEIGNLASNRRIDNKLIFIVLTAVLAKTGYKWVVFTATDQVRLMLRRLQFEPATLCEASATKLLNRNQSWGSYYKSQPRVQAGNVSEAIKLLENNPYTSAQIEKHSEIIGGLVAELRAFRRTGTN
ncbi:MAG: thermostable hemolysin [Gammaproteobacteria bacterium]|nr:thermostable hemolysin [Gammaproteobacteria bacterium]